MVSPIIDKVALITGSAGSTGWKIAETLASHGYAVCIHDMVESACVERANLLQTRHPERPFQGIAADLRDDEAIRTMFAKVSVTYGRLDLLVANAAHQGLGSGDFLDTPIDLFDSVWATNVRGHVLCAQHAARAMAAASGGSIVLIGSNTAMRAIRGRAAYIASKGAIAALTRALAIDLAPHGIRVNEVAPGYINTQRWDTLETTTAERRRANLPLGREASGEDIGEAVVFLASDAAARITGTTITVSSGIDAQMVPSDCEG